SEQRFDIATVRPSTLCRYLRDERLLEALREGKFYCAQPFNFNDPFDGQLLSHYKFSKQDLITAFREELTLFLQSGLKFPGRAEMEPFETLVWFYQNSDVTMTQEEFVNFAVGLLQSKKINLKPSDSERIMISGLANIVRILCLSQEHDNLLLWAHYTEDHSGGIIQLRLDAGSAYLPLSQPVEYSRELPPSGNPKDLARTLLGFSSKSSLLAIQRQLLTKSNHWAYEKEWRIVMKQEFMDENGCAIMRPEDIEAVYLGCRMKLDIKRLILDLIEDKYKNVTVYQAKKDEQEFRLNFIPIRAPFHVGVESPTEKLARMSELYKDCLNMYFRFWNDPYWDVELDVISFLPIDALRLDCKLGQHAPLDIRRIFRLMLDEIEDTVRRTTLLPDHHDISAEMLEVRRNEILRPSALLYQELRNLVDADLQKLGENLPIIA
ncbi:MAG: DUF2971 domain-containing protein, partial [Nitrosospira sp.]